MSLAASLLMLAAVALPPAGTLAPRPPAAAAPTAPMLPAAAPPSRHGVVAIAQASAVILRPAVVRFGRPEAGDRSWQTGDTFFRQTRREGRHVTVDFN